MPLKKLLHAIPVVFLFLFLPTLSYAVCTTTVHPGGSIQTAVSSAVSGNTICIEPGTYKEQISLIDGITLQGNELARTIINGGGTGSAIIAANSTTIMNITVMNINTATNTRGIGINVTDKITVKVNNVIIKDSDAGITCSGVFVPTDLTVDHAVIDHNTTGINLISVPTFSITNSIISNNTTDLTNATLITSSSNHNLTFNNTVKNYPTGDLTNILNSDPLFVNNIDANDYHLQTHTPPSPAIDAGTGTDPDTTAADIGAYGGPNMDTKPFPVSGLLASRESDSSLTITWSANNAYNITGYKVYFDSDASGAPYTGTSAEGQSPVDVGNVVSKTLTGLSGPDTTVVPTGLTTKPGNGRITVSWSQVPGAVGYRVHYGTSSGSYSNSVEVGNTTSYTIENLTNGVDYFIAVSAIFESKYFLSVSARDGQNHESALVNEANVELLPRTEGSLSAEVSDFPEETLPFPNLGDENKCFIATAAYGSPVEPQVMLLRKFRDRFLLTNAFGKKLVSIYYEFSPACADFIREHSWLKPVARVVLLPFIGMAAFCIELSLAQQFLICVFLIIYLISVFLVLRRRKRA